MGEWMDTPYGKRYGEIYGKTTVFFMGTPDENGKRRLPRELLRIILEEKNDLNVSLEGEKRNETDK